MDSSRRRSRPRRSRSALVALLFVAAAVVLELTLQGVSYVLWTREHRDAPSGAAGAVVLCVGDSFTWGLGASGEAFSYPAQLQRMLKSRGSDMHVVNGGWPGQSSEDLALRLERQLAEHAPEHVLVLIGANDGWKTARRVTREECLEIDATEDIGFPLVWRTGQLIALVTTRVTAPAPTPAEAPGVADLSPAIAASTAPATSGEDADRLLGTWYGHDHTLTVEASGRFRLNLTDRPGKGRPSPLGGIMNWRLRGDLMILTRPGLPWELPMHWALDDDVLHLSGPILGEPVAFTRTLGPLQLGWRALRSGDAEQARVLLESVVTDDTLQLSATEGLVEAFVQLGAPSEAEPWLAALRARFAERQELLCGEALAQSLISLGRMQEGLELAASLALEHPQGIRSWELLAGAAQNARRRALVIRTASEALEAMAPMDPMRTLLVHTLAKTLLDDGQADRSLAILLQAADTGRESDRAMQVIYERRDLYTPELLEQALAILALEQESGPMDEERLRAIHADATHSLVARGGRDLLTHNLRVIVELCEQRGVDVTLLTYPHVVASHDEAVARAAEDTGVAMISFRAEFDRLLQARAREELFVEDGHCTDEGYGVMARLVADHLSERQPPP